VSPGFVQPGPGIHRRNRHYGSDCVIAPRLTNDLLSSDDLLSDDLLGSDDPLGMRVAGPHSRFGRDGFAVHSNVSGSWTPVYSVRVR
jgi:hypothetical protein